MEHRLDKMESELRMWTGGRQPLRGEVRLWGPASRRDLPSLHGPKSSFARGAQTTGNGRCAGFWFVALIRKLRARALTRARRANPTRAIAVIAPVTGLLAGAGLIGINVTLAIARHSGHASCGKNKSPAGPHTPTPGDA
jgi:hypothetical protein